MLNLVNVLRLTKKKKTRHQKRYSCDVTSLNFFFSETIPNVTTLHLCKFI